MVTLKKNILGTSHSHIFFYHTPTAASAENSKCIVIAEGLEISKNITNSNR